MIRRLRGGSLWTLAFATSLAVCGAAYAGGANCNHGDKVVAAHDAHEHGGQDAKGEEGSHCNLMKNVSKTAKMTTDGAVITLVGKTPEAIKQIQTHLAVHEKGSDCPECPFNQEGVTAKVKMTDKGGEVTLTGSNPDAVKSVQEWAKKPAGDCCGKMKSA